MAIYSVPLTFGVREHGERSIEYYFCINRQHDLVWAEFVHGLGAQSGTSTSGNETSPEGGEPSSLSIGRDTVSVVLNASRPAAAVRQCVQKGRCASDTS